jgi:hypothetical protein
MDRFITLLAMDTLICNWDGYAINRNNYRVFHDVSRDKMVFMPHGLDQLFGGGQRMGPDSSLNPPMRGLVAHAVMTTTEGRKRYLERLPELLAKHFDEAVLQKKVRDLDERIRPTLAAYSPNIASQHDSEIADLLQRIHERIESAKRQIAAPKPTLTFDGAGKFQVKNWQPRPAQRGALSATFGSRQEDGHTLLVLAAPNGPASGSYRTRVVLGPGIYHLQGRVKMAGTEPNAGVALRMSGVRMPLRPVKGTDWNPLEFTFGTEEEAVEVELVAEFSGASGEALFDMESFVLTRD